MKIRCDFVTNSSSSSFVLGKKGDGLTIQDVYLIIREMYLTYLERRDIYKDYIKKNPKLGVSYDEKHQEFSYERGMDREKREAICDQMENYFHVSYYDSYSYDFDWLSCETYQDYEKYWVKKIMKDRFGKEKSRYGCYAPFTIADFSSEDDVIYVHDGSYKKEAHEISADSDIFDWYYYEDSSLSKYSDDYSNEASSLKKYKDDPFACLNGLGHICVYSECGYIPASIVEQLRNLSNYACNHMG